MLDFILFIFYHKLKDFFTGGKMQNFLDLIQKRRSIYHLNRKTDISLKEIIKTVETCLKYTPTAFNSQTGRIVILFHEPYLSFWNSTKKTLKKITSPEKFEQTKEKIDSFKKGIGTILFFEEQHTLEALEEKFTLYKDNFQIWSNQSSGMLQYAVWLALAELNLGANLQHYNPLVDEYIYQTFNLPQSWKLMAQMNFGGIQKEADEKTFLDINKRLHVFK